MEKCYFGFTATAWAYDNTPEKVKNRLLDEHKRTGVTGNRYGLSDVTHLSDGVGIMSEPWTAKTDSGEELKVTVHKFSEQ